MANQLCHPLPPLLTSLPPCGWTNSACPSIEAVCCISGEASGALSAAGPTTDAGAWDGVWAGAWAGVWGGPSKDGDEAGSATADAGAWDGIVWDGVWGGPSKAGDEAGSATTDAGTWAGV